jgi:hypothetical protein
MHETTWSAGIEMPILTVRHVTAYYYKTPVAFGEHRMILRPRDDDDQQVLETQARNHTRAQPTDLDAGHVWQSRGARSEWGNRCKAPGTPSDYLAMKVTVRLAALAAESARHPTMLCKECSGSRSAVGDDRTEP